MAKITRKRSITAAVVLAAVLSAVVAVARMNRPPADED